MIFVTVGNATQGFQRLLVEMDSLAGTPFLKNQSVFMQSGHNADFKSKHSQCQTFLAMEDFQEKMERADLIICHGGCGTILHAMRLGKIPVVMPRRKKYGEHVNDHQMQLVQALGGESRIIPAYEREDLSGAIAKAFEENNRRKGAGGRSDEKDIPMLDLVSKAIEELIGKNK